MEVGDVGLASDSVVTGEAVRSDLVDGGEHDSLEEDPLDVSADLSLGAVDVALDAGPSVLELLSVGELSEHDVVLALDDFLFAAEVGSQSDDLVLELGFTTGHTAQSLLVVLDLLLQLHDLVLLLVQDVSVVHGAVAALLVLQRKIDTALEQAVDLVLEQQEPAVEVLLLVGVDEQSAFTGEVIAERQQSVLEALKQSEVRRPVDDDVFAFFSGPREGSKIVSDDIEEFAFNIAGQIGLGTRAGRDGAGLSCRHTRGNTRLLSWSV